MTVRGIACFRILVTYEPTAGAYPPPDAEVVEFFTTRGNNLLDHFDFLQALFDVAEGTLRRPCFSSHVIR